MARRQRRYEGIDMASAIGHAVIRARFTQAAGDAAQRIADRNRPGFAAKAEDRDEWKTYEEQARAMRARQSRQADMAANLILDDAGFRSVFFRRR